MVKITIDTQNAAFDDKPSAEVARILRRLAQQLDENGPMDIGRLRDINGNPVGAFTWSA